MIALAASIGADVPFFVIESQSVLATGIGEKMLPVPPLSDCTYLLVNPGFSVSTATIFKKFALTRADKNSTLTGSRKLSNENLHISSLENDLEAVTIALFPVIAELKEELRKAGADNVLMSGSGPTVFGVFSGTSKQSGKTIENAAKRLRQKIGNRVYITE
jgi:4-diphosphocytidyl-2-C-methyl-D-erythritol kinase